MSAYERAGWVDRSGSALRGAVLALLVQRSEPIYPYRLGTLLQRHLGAAWQIDHKALYRLLGGLEREGFVRSELNPEAKSESRVYTATETAERALDDWMRSGVAIVPHRAELQARLAVSRERDLPHLERAFDEYERDCFQLIAEAAAADLPLRSWRAVAINMARTGDNIRLTAEIEWVQKSRALIEDWRQRPSGKTGDSR